MHTKELEELKHAAFKDSGINPEEFFRNELTNAIREIRREYESANQAQRVELDRMYRLKVTEIRRMNAPQLTLNSASDMVDREQARKIKLEMHETKRNVYDLRAKVRFFLSKE
jgi:intermediate filament protein if